MKNFDDVPFCSECVSNISNIFKQLNQQQIEDLNYIKSCNFHKRGEIIYHEGNRPTGVYCVSKGIIKLYKTGIEGKEQIIRFAKKGDIIGYRSVLSTELACTTAKVIEDAVVCFIPSETWMEMLQNNSNFSMDVMRFACNELGKSNSFITDIAQKNVRERLAEILLYLKDDFGIDADGVLQISLTREELANITGTATESAIRLLSEFKDDKMIALNGRKIAILDENRLKKTANLY
ncbi:MAG: Crp/Fnr family transcriptional regulator [Bacteroidales bacterium]|nr:Crp/Fnr family transcriptional regulator [Bacteroidales bacterium]